MKRNIEKERLDAIVEQLLISEQLPSVAAILTKGDTILWSHCVGDANLSAGRPADLETIYHLGSVTKLFTAFMLMQLRDAERLKLDDLLSSFLPEVADTNLPPITLRQLASHTSGLPPMPPIQALIEAMANFSPDVESLEKMVFPSRDEVLESLPKVVMMSEPGTEVAYSNLGIALLAMALERAAGQSYKAYIDEAILKPLGMENSGFSDAIRAHPALVTCYMPFSDPPDAAPFATKLINAFAPAGSLWSSAEEMGRFLIQLSLTELSCDTNLLPRQALRDMLQPILPVPASHFTGAEVEGGVAVGWFVSSIDDKKLVEHGGADPSTATYLGWMPEQKVGVFVATNSGKNPMAVGAAGRELLGAVLSGR